MYETIDERTLRRISDGSGIPLAEGNSDYQKVLDDIISQGADCFEGDIPTELQTAADAKQLDRYSKAMDRLSKFVVADGREEVTEEVVLRQEFDDEAGDIVDITETRVVLEAIDPVPATITRTVYSGDADPTEETIENPLITEDNAERAEAQAVVDATPQSVIDTYNE